MQLGWGVTGLIRFFWVFGVWFDRQWWCVWSGFSGFLRLGLIGNSGVGLISFLWVSMGLGFSGDGGGVCYFGKWVWSAGWCCWWRIWIKDGEFGFVFLGCGLGFMNLVWMNVKEYLVMGLWVYFLDLWVWFIEASMLNVLEFSVLRLVMNVGRLGLS